jgi:hypothetical protein
MRVKPQIAVIAGAAVVLAAFFRETPVNLVVGPFREAASKRGSLEKEIDKLNKKLRDARRAATALEEWERSSLPDDAEMARNAYQEWLLETVRRVRLQSPAVRGGEISPRGTFDAASFSLTARGTAEQWIRFLYEFYRAGHLHQIRAMNFTPYPALGALDGVITIEALRIPKGNTSDRLNSEPENRLAFESPREYQSILRRDLFGLGAAPDPIELARVTGIESINGVPKVWITQQGEAAPDRAVLKLGVGDSLELGLWSGTVVQILADDVCFESGGEYWVVSVGETLAQAAALPAVLFESPPPTTQPGENAPTDTPAAEIIPAEKTGSGSPSAE